MHLLRYLRDNALLGIKFYSDLSRAPLVAMLKSQEIEQRQAFFGFWTLRGMMIQTPAEAQDVLLLLTWAELWITAQICLIQLRCHQPKRNTTKDA